MNKKNILNSKIIFWFLWLSIIPILFTIIDLSTSYKWNYINLIFVYNFNNSFWLAEILPSWVDEIKAIIITIYNYLLMVFLYNVSLFTKKYILRISFIIAILSWIVWWTYLWILMSV